MRQGHHRRLTRNIAKFNLRIALWEVFLEGFCVALVVGVVAVGALASVVLVAVPVPAVVVVLVVGVVPVVAVAGVSVLFWVCESGVVSQGWVGEVVEGRSGVWVDGVLSAGLMRMSVKKTVLRSFLRLGGVFGWV